MSPGDPKNPETSGAAPRSLPLLGLALQHTAQLTAINLASTNVTGVLGCSNAGTALQELDLSNTRWPINSLMRHGRVRERDRCKCPGLRQRPCGAMECQNSALFLAEPPPPSPRPALFCCVHALTAMMTAGQPVQPIHTHI